MTRKIPALLAVFTNALHVLATTTGVDAPALTPAPVPGNGCSSAALLYGTSPPALSSLTWDCAHYLGVQLITSTILTTSTLTASARVGTLYTSTNSTDFTVPGAPTSTFNQYRYTYVLATAATRTWTTTIPDFVTHYTVKTLTETKVQTANETVTERFTNGAKTVYAPDAVTVTATALPVYDSINAPIPTRFRTASDCSPGDLDSYCSHILGAPVPTPTTTIEIGFFFEHRTVYETTITTFYQRTRSFLIEYTTIHSTVETTPTVTGKRTVHITIDAPGTQTTTTTTVLTTATVTITVPATEAAISSTTTTTLTPTITIPPICKLPDPPAVNYFYRHSELSWVHGDTDWDYQFAIRILPAGAAKSRIECCAICHSSVNCPIYEWLLGKDGADGECRLRRVETESWWPGYKTDLCPRGMLSGNFEMAPLQTEKTIYQGHCWNGWRSGQEQIPELSY